MLNVQEALATVCFVAAFAAPIMIYADFLRW
jgi:hypothetical protein